MRKLFLTVIFCFTFPAVASEQDAQIALDAGDYVKAIQFLEPLASNGNSVAQNNLGVLYKEGHGVSVNYSEALKWFITSSDNGYYLGSYNVGMMYLFGRGVQKNLEKAAFYFEKSAEKNHAISQFNLGRIYEGGSALHYSAPKRNDEKAIYYYKKASENNYPPAQTNLSMMYRDGRGVPKDYNEALRLASLAAKSGDTDGQGLLGLYYSTNIVVGKNYKEALKWYEMAAEKGNTASILNMGIIYESEDYKDYILSYALYNLASTKEPMAVALREKVGRMLSSKQVMQAQTLSTDMSKYGFKKIFQRYISSDVKNKRI